MCEVVNSSLDDVEILRKDFLAEAGLDGPKNSCKRSQALDRAWAVRNFEIDLYWKRSLYFWGFQVAFLAGASVAVGMLNGADRRVEPFLILFGILLSLFGCISSTLWAALERGSKDWQDNWEKHIDLLEDEFTGAIYKTYVVPTEKNRPSFSVSKLNSWMTFVTAGFWCVSLTILFLGLNGRYQIFPMGPAVIVGLVGVGAFLLWLRHWARIELTVRTGWDPDTEQRKTYKVLRRNIFGGSAIDQKSDHELVENGENLGQH